MNDSSSLTHTSEQVTLPGCRLGRALPDALKEEAATFRCYDNSTVIAILPEVSTSLANRTPQFSAIICIGCHGNVMVLVLVGYVNVGWCGVGCVD